MYLKIRHQGIRNPVLILIKINVLINVVYISSLSVMCENSFCVFVFLLLKLFLVFEIMNNFFVKPA